MEEYKRFQLGANVGMREKGQQEEKNRVKLGTEVQKARGRFALTVMAFSKPPRLVWECTELTFALGERAWRKPALAEASRLAAREF